MKKLRLKFHIKSPLLKFCPIEVLLKFQNSLCFCLIPISPTSRCKLLRDFSQAAHFADLNTLRIILFYVCAIWFKYQIIEEFLGLSEMLQVEVAVGVTLFWFYGSWIFTNWVWENLFSKKYFYFDLQIYNGETRLKTKQTIVLTSKQKKLQRGLSCLSSL